MVYGYALAVFIGALALGFLLHIPVDAEHWSYDWMVSKFSTRLKSQHDKIVLVYISNSTLDDLKLAYVSPIDRGLISDLVQAIDHADAKVIGLDIILDRHTDREKDEALRNTIHHTRAKMVVGAIAEGANGPHVQSDFFFAPEGGTAPEVGNIYFDERHTRGVISDHVVRYMVENAKGGFDLPFDRTFAEVLARAYESAVRPQSPYIAFRPQSPYIAWLQPTAADGTETFMTLTAEDVLGRGKAKLPLQDLLKDKIVLIGANFDDRDQHLIPLSVSHDDFYPGLFIHAQILAQLMDGRSIYELSLLVRLLLAAAVGVCGYLLGRISGHYQIWLELFSVAGLVLIAFLAFLLFKLVLPYNPMLFAWLAGAAVGHYGRVETRKHEPVGIPAS